MSKMVKFYDEIFKLIPLIDAKWDEILARKEDVIKVGLYLISKEKAKWDDHHEYWKVSIDIPMSYSNKNLNVVCFYERGRRSSIDAIPYNISTHDSMVMSKYTDTVIFRKENSTGNEEEHTRTIPYDKTCSVEERKFSVDLSIKSAGEREFLNRMIDFQNMELKHIDLFTYAFNMFDAICEGNMYNDLISRPFFKY